MGVLVAADVLIHGGDCEPIGEVRIIESVRTTEEESTVERKFVG